MASARCTFSSDNMVIKSPNDSRLYRLIELDNGLQALLIHDPEIYPDGPPKTLENGEQVDEENDDDAEGSEEEEDEDEDEDDEEDEDEEDEDEDEEVKEKGKKGSSSQTKKVSLCLNLNKVTECESNSPFGC